MKKSIIVGILSVSLALNTAGFLTTFDKKPETAVAAPKLTEDYVVEHFVITNIAKNGKDIRGELKNGTGEGIFLTKSYYKDFDNIKKQLDVGDVIAVTYDKDDYLNEVWDNILDIENVGGGK